MSWASIISLELIVTQEVVFAFTVRFPRNDWFVWGFSRSIVRKCLIKKVKLKSVPVVLSTSLPVTRDGAQIKTTNPNDRKVIFSKLKKKTFDELTEGKQVRMVTLTSTAVFFSLQDQ